MAYAAEAPARTSVRPEARYFYVYLAITSVAIAFLGFLPTYWMPIAAGTFKAKAVVHIHGAICFCWTLYLVYQTWLAATGRVARHRAVGLIGVSLATALTIFGPLVAIGATRHGIAMGGAQVAKALMIIPITGITFFAMTIILALVNVRRPEWHKRLMLLATVSILPAAAARWFLTYAPPTGTPTPSLDLPATGVVSLLLVAAMIHDWRTRGRVHGVFVWGGGFFAVMHLLQTPISTTESWQSFAGWLASLPG